MLKQKVAQNVINLLKQKVAQNVVISLDYIILKNHIETAHWHGPPALFGLSSYVASHCLALAPQSGTKEQFHCAVYYITLN